MKSKTTRHGLKRMTALLLAVVLCVGMVPTAFAAQQNSYHDPAEHWMQASGRTNELDANSVVTRETFKCGECGKATSFEVFRVPEYTRNGQPALSRNVKYSDGTMVDGVGKGDTMDGIPGKDATYTGYHYTKAVCETCGGINTNMSKSEYGYLKNVYWLYDCAAAFTQELDETVSYEYTDDTYHTVTTKGGTYCAFCYGTNHTVSRKLERHSMVTEVLPQPANGRFATVEKCSLCDYTRYDYTAAKAVVASYYGVVDGQPHTISVTDLSEAGVRTSIRYGNSADSCTMTSAPNYTDEGQYTVYYEITYTCDGVDMTENGVAYVWLRDDTTDENGNCGCGCSNPNCGCQNKNCNGNCCADKGCGENHKYILLDSTKAGCTSLGYDRYLCTECGKIEKRDYVDSLGHAWQSIVIRDATCETDGKLLELCSRCGQMKQTATPKGEHSYEVYTVAATCTSPGYTVRECSVCGDRHIEDITPAIPHDYKAHVIEATCDAEGKTIHRCDGCGSSFVTDYTEALGHSWDKGTLVTNATCTGEGVMEYRCTRCGYHRLDADPADGHIPGAPATCTEPQLCTRCGAVLKNALGHDYKSEVTAPTCTEMGYTTNTCTRCGDTTKTDYTESAGHKPGDWIIDKEPTTDAAGSKHKECTVCGEKLEAQPIEKIYNSATTDSKGEAIVGGYLVTVTDTDTKNPVANAAVALHKDNSISIRLPNSRLLAQVLHGWSGIFSSADHPALANYVKMILQEMQTRSLNYEISVRGLFVALITEVMRLSTEQNDSASANRMVIAPALTYIDEFYMENFSIRDLADACSMSESHFRRVFRELVGMGPLDYLNRTRIAKACSLLRMTDDSILTISEKVGFGSMSSFNRHFYEVMGTAPSDWRRATGTGIGTSILKYSGWLRPPTP